MNTQHTAGPWKFEDEYVRDATGEIVADIYTLPSTTHGDEMEANARLIACAPEMLEALKWTHKKYSEFMDYDHKFCEICPLIARAEGRE